MERIWLKSYPAGVPADIKFDEFKSVGALVDKKVVEFAGRPAFHCMGKSISFAELDQLSKTFGAWLQSKGYGKGVRVAIMMPRLISGWPNFALSAAITMSHCMASSLPPPSA